MSVPSNTAVDRIAFYGNLKNFIEDDINKPLSQRSNDDKAKKPKNFVHDALQKDEKLADEVLTHIVPQLRDEQLLRWLAIELNDMVSDIPGRKNQKGIFLNGQPLENIDKIFSDDNKKNWYFKIRDVCLKRYEKRRDKDNSPVPDGFFDQIVFLAHSTQKKIDSKLFDVFSDEAWYDKEKIEKKVKEKQTSLQNKKNQARESRDTDSYGFIRNSPELDFLVMHMMPLLHELDKQIEQREEEKVNSIVFLYQMGITADIEKRQIIAKEVRSDLKEFLQNKNNLSDSNKIQELRKKITGFKNVNMGYQGALSGPGRLDRFLVKLESSLRAREKENVMFEKWSEFESAMQDNSHKNQSQRQKVWLSHFLNLISTTDQQEREDIVIFFKNRFILSQEKDKLKEGLQKLSLGIQDEMDNEKKNYILGDKRYPKEMVDQLMKPFLRDNAPDEKEAADQDNQTICEKTREWISEIEKQILNLKAYKRQNENNRSNKIMRIFGADRVQKNALRDEYEDFLLEQWSKLIKNSLSDNQVEDIRCEIVRKMEEFQERNQKAYLLSFFYRKGGQLGESIDALIAKLGKETVRTPSPNNSERAAA